MPDLMHDRWHVVVTGRAVDLDRLTALFGGGKIRMERDGASTILVSDEFVALANARAILERAREFLLQMIGLAQLDARGTKQAQAGAVVRTAADGKRHHHVICETHKINLEDGLCVAFGDFGGAAGPPSPPPEQAWLEKAASSPAASEALAIFSGEKTWASLYKVFELISANAPVDLAAWASKAERSRFTGSANNPAVSGRDARHAVHDGSLPKSRAMTLDDGIEFISRMLKGWLQQ